MRTSDNWWKSIRRNVAVVDIDAIYNAYIAIEDDTFNNIDNGANDAYNRNNHADYSGIDYTYGQYFSLRVWVKYKNFPATPGKVEKRSKPFAEAFFDSFGSVLSSKMRRGGQAGAGGSGGGDFWSQTLPKNDQQKTSRKVFWKFFYFFGSHRRVFGKAYINPGKKIKWKNQKLRLVIRGLFASQFRPKLNLFLDILDFSSKLKFW